MLRAAIVFFLIAIVAYLFGAFGVAGISMEAGRIFLFMFLVLAIVSFVINLFRGGKSPRI